MMDPTDFPVVEPVYVPDFSATLIIVGVLLLAVAFLAGLLAQHLFQILNPPRRAHELIFTSINKKATDAAAKIEDGAMRGAAESLTKEIESRLHNLIALSTDLNKQYAEIKKLLKEVSEPGSTGGQKSEPATADGVTITIGRSPAAPVPSKPSNSDALRNALLAFARNWSKDRQDQIVALMGRTYDELRAPKQVPNVSSLAAGGGTKTKKKKKNSWERNLYKKPKKDPFRVKAS